MPPIEQTKKQKEATFQAAGVRPVERIAPITPKDLSGNASPIQIPEQKRPDFTSTANIASSAALTPPKTFTTPNGAVVDAQGNVITEAPQKETAPTTSITERLKSLIGGEAKPEKPTSLVEQEKALQEQYHLQEKQNTVDSLSSELLALRAESQNIPLQLQQEYAGRGATRAGVNVIQIGRLRENAIKQLPVAAQLQAAQMRLDSAVNIINKTLDLQYKDNQALREWNNTLFDRAYAIASNDQQKELEIWKQKKEDEADTKNNFLDTKKSWIDYAVNAGDYQTAAKMSGAENEEELNSLTSLITPATEAQKFSKEIISAEPDKPLTINQIEQFRRSYGWTPPFGYTISQLKQYMKDNPNATPEELEAGARSQITQTANNTNNAVINKTSDNVVNYIMDNIDDTQLKLLKTKADAAGISSIWKPKRTDVKNYLESIKDKIQVALDEGYTEKEILDYLAS